MHDEESRRAVRLVGLLLRLLRQLNALSLSKASDSLGIDQSRLVVLEAGKVELNDKLLRPIAKLYRVEVDFLFLPFDQPDAVEAVLSGFDFEKIE